MINKYNSIKEKQIIMYSEDQNTNIPVRLIKHNNYEYQLFVRVGQHPEIRSKSFSKDDLKNMRSHLDEKLKEIREICYGHNDTQEKNILKTLILPILKTLEEI